MNEAPIYLDYNGSTPIDPQVAEAMLPYLMTHFGNPSSSHAYGKRLRRAVEEAREQVAALLGCEAAEIIFTSGGTESNNLALFGATMALREKGSGRHIITSRVEHPAIVEPCLSLLEQGFDVTFLPVDGHGQVQVDELEAAIRPDTVLVSIMHSNNEVGTLQPIAAISRVTRARGIVLHTDAAQSLGKVAVRTADLGVDLLSVAGHKLYAPKGIGALYVARGVTMERRLFGAGQERGLSPGTENVLGIVGLGAAAAMAAERLQSDGKHLRELRDRLEARLMQAVPDAVVHGRSRERLPNTLSIGFSGIAADHLLSELQTVAASAGAACHSDQVKISHVLEAMGVPKEIALGTVRFTVGRFTTVEEIDRAARDVAAEVQRLRAAGGGLPT